MLLLEHLDARFEIVLVVLLAHSAAHRTLPVLQAPKRLRNPGGLLSSLLVFKGVLFVEELTILVDDGLIEVLALFVG